MRCLPSAAILIALGTLSASGDTLNVSVNTSALAGTNLKVVFDVTANTLGLNTLNIENFSAPGATMALPETTGGLVDGDLILIQNPAAFTFVQTGSFFNELIVNLDPVSNGLTFSLSYSTNAPGSGTAPDEIAFFLLDSSYLPLFPTTDPLGTDALFAIDLNGASTSTSIYAPAIQTSPGNVQITVPGTVATVPEPDSFSLILTMGLILAASKLFQARRLQQ